MAKSIFLTSERVRAFEDCPEICLRNFYDGSFLANLFLYQHEKMYQNLLESSRINLVMAGIPTNPDYKIRPSLTTSKEGLKTEKLFYKKGLKAD